MHVGPWLAKPRFEFGSGTRGTGHVMFATALFPARDTYSHRFSAINVFDFVTKPTEPVPST